MLTGVHHTATDEEGAARLEHALSRLDGLIDWERRDREDLERTLAPIRDLCARVGRPHDAYRVVHVAGTKGKSSTAALIAHGLSRADYSVGCYSSPHVEVIHERIRLDGELVRSDAFAAGLEAALAARESALGTSAPAAQATYFDVLTAAALCVFRDAGVDWVVLECGLGGRLDSTNCVSAEICVVTNIDLEHTEVLGNTHAEIAGEKVGILDPGVPLVTGVEPGSDAGRVLESRAKELGSELIRPDFGDAGIAQRNVLVARSVLDELARRGVLDKGGEALLTDEEAERARLPGRMEFFSARSKTVVLDGAHVASSVDQVLSEAERRLGHLGAATCVLALRADKDAASVLKTLSHRVDRVICTSLDSAPFRSAEELEALARAEGLAAEAVRDPREALDRALEPKGGWVLALGSLYLAGALRPGLVQDRA